MRPRPFFRTRLLLVMFAAGLATSLATPPAFANSYKRANFSCKDFQRAEKYYRSDPTGGYAGAYALCLIARNRGDDVRALTILDSEIAKGNVPAARLKAFYIASGGTMANKLDDRNYNEALQAYGKVLLLINLQPDYPKGFEITEEAQQHELEAYAYLVYISYFKSVDGMVGIHNAHLLQSASYKGGRNLKLYPQYRPYTVDSLERTVEYAETCANLPKKHYFQTLKYHQTTAYCRMVEKAAGELLDLEKERLTLLDGKTCARDIEQCSKYQSILNRQIIPLVKKFQEEDIKIWKTTSVTELSRL